MGRKKAGIQKSPKTTKIDLQQVNLSLINISGDSSSLDEAPFVTLRRKAPKSGKNNKDDAGVQMEADESSENLDPVAVVQEEKIVVPKFLHSRTDLSIFSPEQYEEVPVTPYLIQEFKKSTNLDWLVDNYLAEQNELRTTTTDNIFIKTFFSTVKSKHVPPMNRLKYDPGAELKLNFLAHYPEINSAEKYGQYLKFLGTNGLSLCSVDLTRNNPALVSANEMIQALGNQKILSNKEKIEHKILSDYWKSIGGQETYYFQDIGREEFQDITNYAEVIAQCLRKPTTPERIEDKIIEYFWKLKDKPERRHTGGLFPKVLPHPWININWNTISKNQENFLCYTYMHFKNGSNIVQLLQKEDPGLAGEELKERINLEWFKYRTKAKERKEGIFKDLELNREAYRTGIVHDPEILEFCKKQELKKKEEARMERMKQKKTTLEKLTSSTSEKAPAQLSSSKLSDHNSSCSSSNETVIFVPLAGSKRLDMRDIEILTGKKRKMSEEFVPIKRSAQELVVIQDSPRKSQEVVMEVEEPVKVEKIPQIQVTSMKIQQSELEKKEKDKEDKNSSLEELLKSLESPGPSDKEKIAPAACIANYSTPKRPGCSVLPVSVPAPSISVIEVNSPVPSTSKVSISTAPSSTTSSPGNQLARLALVRIPTKSPAELKESLLEKLKNFTNVAKVLHVLKEKELGTAFRGEWKRRKQEMVAEYLEEVIEKSLTFGMKFKEGWSKEEMLQDIENYKIALEQDLLDQSSVISYQEVFDPETEAVTPPKPETVTPPKPETVTQPEPESVSPPRPVTPQTPPFSPVKPVIPVIPATLAIKQENVTESECTYSEVEVLENLSASVIVISDSDEESSDELVRTRSKYISTNDDLMAELQRKNQVSESSQSMPGSCSENLLGESEDSPTALIASINIQNPPSRKVPNVAIYSRLRRVEYHKEKIPRFQLFVDLPEFDLFSVAIKNENVWKFLDLNERQVESLNYLLDLLGDYELECWAGSLQQKTSSLVKIGNKDLKDVMDQYFQTLPQLRPFYFRNSLDSLICYDSNFVPVDARDVTHYLDTEILEQIRKFKEG